MEIIKIQNAKYIFMPKNSGLKNYAQKALLNLSLNKDVMISERRGEDIPYLIAELSKSKVPALGITGDDLFDEARYKNKEVNENVSLIDTIDWIDENALFGRPVLALLAKQGLELVSSKSKEVPIVGIPKKYEYTALRYLARRFKLEIYPREKAMVFSGGVEENIVLGVYDFAIDVVYTGSSLKKARLKIVDTLRASDISTVANAQLKFNRV